MCQDYHIEFIFGTIRKDEELTGYMVTSTKMVMSPKMRLTVFDRVGGGDGFAAGAIDGYLTHMEPQELIHYATASGVLAHTTYGDSPVVSKEEIIDFMKNGKRDIKR